MDVISVDITSPERSTLKHIGEFTLERNRMDVTSVDIISLQRVILKPTREFTLEKHHTTVISVRASLRGMMN